MRVVSNRVDCYAIGTDSNDSPGDIVIEMGGKLFVEANGDTVTAIGGGKNENSKVIRILGGDVTVLCSGRNCLGIGIADGNSIVDIENCKCNIMVTSPNCVGIGSIKGSVDINVKNIMTTLKLSGITAAGFGTPDGGSGRIIIRNGDINCCINGRTVNCIGTRNGSINCMLNNDTVTLYCESASVSGIGDMYGDGDVCIEETEMDFTFLTGEGMAYGSRNGLVQLSKCTEQISINA